MKKLNFRILLNLFVIATIFVSCSDDKDDPKNHISYNGTTKTISAGLLDYYGSANLSSYNFDVTLYDGFNYSQTDGFYGTGDYIYFELFSSSSTELASGTYTFDATESMAPNTFDIGELALGYNVAEETADVYKEIISGTVKVQKEGTTYTININCTASDGKKISGFYKGSLAYGDNTDGRKKSNLIK